MQELVQVSK